MPNIRQFWNRKLETVYGHAIAPPRVTLTGVFLAVAVLGVPIMVLALILDVMVWLIARSAFDTCVGLWCR